MARRTRRAGMISITDLGNQFLNRVRPVLERDHRIGIESILESDQILDTQLLRQFVPPPSLDNREFWYQSTGQKFVSNCTPEEITRAHRKHLSYVRESVRGEQVPPSVLRQGLGYLESVYRRHLLTKQGFIVPEVTFPDHAIRLTYHSNCQTFTLPQVSVEALSLLERTGFVFTGNLEVPYRTEEHGRFLEWQYGYLNSIHQPYFDQALPIPTPVDCGDCVALEWWNQLSCLTLFIPSPDNGFGNTGYAGQPVQALITDKFGMSLSTPLRTNPAACWGALWQLFCDSQQGIFAHLENEVCRIWLPYAQWIQE